MIVKLLTEHHLECLSLKGGCRGSSESTLVKYHIVGNHISYLFLWHNLFQCSLADTSTDILRQWAHTGHSNKGSINSYPL